MGKDYINGFDSFSEDFTFRLVQTRGEILVSSWGDLLVRISPVSGLKGQTERSICEYQKSGHGQGTKGFTRGTSW